jgi:cell pole-organizing protein PopZ
MIGQILEPLLRQWIDNNLPRMVESVVREEVKRALKTEGKEQEPLAPVLQDKGA